MACVGAPSPASKNRQLAKRESSRRGVGLNKATGDEETGLHLLCPLPLRAGPAAVSAAPETEQPAPAELLGMQAGRLRGLHQLLLL